MKIASSSLYFLVFIPLVCVASFRLLDVGADYYSYKYIYENRIASEPIFFALNLAFESLSIPFEIFHLILSLIAFYWFIKFLTRRNMGFFIVFSSSVFFYVYHIASHWRTGLALALICLLLDRNIYSKAYGALLPALVHISSLVIFLTGFLAQNKILLTILILYLSLFSLEIVTLIGKDFFAIVGREKFYHAILQVADGSHNYLHRSLLTFDNVRIYFVLLTSALMWSDWSNKKSQIINVVMLANFAYLMFLFNAYIAQKSYLLFVPLQFAASAEIVNKNKRWLCMLVVFLSLCNGVFERYFGN